VRSNFVSLNDAGLPPCTHSVVCDPANGGCADRGALARVEWRQTMGYTFSYPFQVMADDNGSYHSGVPAVGIDSRDNLWIFQRNRAGRHPSAAGKFGTSGLRYGPL